jgi:hypothetical protein
MSGKFSIQNTSKIFPTAWLKEEPREFEDSTVGLPLLLANSLEN